VELAENIGDVCRGPLEELWRALRSSQAWR